MRPQITTYSQRIEHIRDEIKDLMNIFCNAELNCVEQDSATQDILHTIELSSYEQGRKYYNKLRQIRKRRRENKDTLTILSRFYSLMTEYDQKGVKVGVEFMKQLDQALGSSRTEEQKMKNRHYNPKYYETLPIKEDN